MVIVKRKAVATRGAAQLFKGSAKGRAAKKAELEEKPEVEEQDEAQHDEDPEVEGEEQEEQEVDEELALSKREEEMTAARRKELKGMAAGDIKELTQSNGLELGNKQDMIEALLQHEVEGRAKERARQAELRDVVTQKKEELEGLSVPELKALCDAAGAKGIMSKQARLELLMKQWQEEDGIDKAVAKRARDARQAEFGAMDKTDLRRLCSAANVDPLVKEVMVDRIAKREGELGRFAKPQLPADEEKDVAGGKSEKKAKDMVEALLSSEATRKRENEFKKQEEDAAASKRKELRALSVEELKKAISKKGREPEGKKEDLVEALFTIGQEEEAAAAKKAKLKALAIEDLKQRVVSKGLEPSKKRDEMVESLLKHEADVLEKCRAYESKIEEVLAKKKDELDRQTANQLKELCAAKGLKLGVAKQDRIETLLDSARTDGEVDKVLASAAKSARKDELLVMESAAVLEVCGSLSIDPMVKELAVERLMAYEDEHGRVVVEQEEERPAKRARKAGKK